MNPDLLENQPEFFKKSTWQREVAVCNPSTQEPKAGRPRVQDHPWLGYRTHSQVNLDYVRSSLQENKAKTTEAKERERVIYQVWEFQESFLTHNIL